MMDDTILDEILDGYGIACGWWGYDKAMETPGAHLTSNRQEIQAKAKAKARLQALLVEARKKVWLELKRGDGLYTNESGCREVHVDYINERLAALDTPATQIGGEES